MVVPKRTIYSAILGLSVVLGDVAVAQSNTPGASFKRVRVGESAPGDLINIQIDPEADVVAAPSIPDTNAAKTDSVKKADLQDWFWTKISPSIASASGSRMTKAVEHMSVAPSYFRPSLSDMRKLAARHGRDIVIGSLGTEVSPALILAMISVESSGKVDAESNKGAQGLMQLIPATAERFGVSDPMDPLQNIQGGAKYMAWLLKEFQDDPLLALAAYNAGENAVKKNGGVPEYPETRAYVPKVVAAWQVASGLCKSPPSYVWQGCAFAVTPEAKGAAQ